jgi:Tat protein translocase TatB subunit
MFDVGFQELVLVSIIGLLVLGPQRLPKVAAEIGKWVGRARRTATQLRRQLEREIELSDLQPPPPPPATATTPSPTAPPASETPADSATADSPGDAGATPTAAVPPQGEPDSKPPPN